MIRDQLGTPMLRDHIGATVARYQLYECNAGAVVTITVIRDQQYLPTTLKRAPCQ